MKAIVVATDFSENANSAIKFTAMLAARTTAAIILFNSFQIPIHASNARISAAGVNELLKANKERLEKQATEIATTYGVKVSAHTSLTELSEALDELVSNHKADLVVLGMHANDWSDRLFGNTTTEIIRNANYPILVVPPDATFTEVKKILYSFDGNRHSIPVTLSILSEIASKLKAEVQIFHVVVPNKPNAVNRHPEEEVYPEIEAALKDISHGYKEVAANLVTAGIENEIKENNANLLVMVPHKLSMWESIFNQSMTRAMALRTHIPLLVLPNAKIENTIPEKSNNQIEV